MYIYIEREREFSLGKYIKNFFGLGTDGKIEIQNRRK